MITLTAILICFMSPMGIICHNYQATEPHEFHTQIECEEEGQREAKKFIEHYPKNLMYKVFVECEKGEIS